MKSTTLITSLFAAVVMAESSLNARQFGPGGDATQKPPQTPKPGMISPQGCFSSKGDLKNMGDEVKQTFLTMSSCVDACEQDKSFTVAALAPDGCYCGSTMPPKSDLVKDEECNYSCPGFPLEACGGKSGEEVVYSVFNLGLDLNPPRSGGKGSDEGDNDGADEDEEGESSTSTGESSTVTSTTTSTATSDSTESTEATEATTTASTPAETSSSSEEGEDEGEEESGDDGEGDIGSTMGRSIAVVAAVAGGSAWFLM